MSSESDRALCDWHSVIESPLLVRIDSGSIKNSEAGAFFDGDVLNQTGFRVDVKNEHAAAFWSRAVGQRWVFRFRCIVGDRVRRRVGHA